MTTTPRHLQRTVLSLLAAGGLVVGGVLSAAPGGSGSGPLPSAYDAQVRQRAEAVAEQRPHTHAGQAAPAAGLDDGHGHVHDDPTTKNAISRSGEAAQARDRTTPVQRAASRARVAAQRTQREPRLVGVPLRSKRRLVPEDVYAMAGGCYRLGGQSLTFQATGLGSYLLHAPDRTFLAASGSGATWAATPSPESDWTVREAGSGRFTFTLADGRALRRTTGGFATGAADSFALRRTDGCTAFPEVETNVSGRPFGGVTSFQEVRGFVDPHVHGQTHEFLGGRVICSPPFHRYGAAAALVDCPDHQVAGGRGAALEDVLAGTTPGSGHDPVGWPTFSYWPNPHSLTHQQVYYKWLERSWRAGLRIHTSLLTENHVLCTVYPLKKNSCDDRDAVRLQAQDMRAMQDYIDAQHGGPGRGWYRIVTDPFEARRVINQGKLAVVMGMETSVPLGCNVQLGRPTCTEEQMLAELAEMKKLGVSQMELTNKFDNAFTGVAGDAGTIGPLTNSANFLSTGSFLRMQTCPTSYAPGTEDRLQSPNLGDLGGSGWPAGSRAGRHLRRHLEALRRPRRAAGPDLSRRSALQPARPQPARQAADLGDDRQPDPVRPRPHERRRPQRSAGLPRAAAGRRPPGRGRVVALVVDPGRLPAHLPARRLRRALRRRLDGLRREVAPAPRVDRRALLLRLRLRLGHERLRGAG